MDHLPMKSAPLLVVLFAIAVMALWPLAVVWSLNTLFHSGIPYEIRSWLAVVILVTIARLVIFPLSRQE